MSVLSVIYTQNKIIMTKQLLLIGLFLVSSISIFAQSKFGVKVATGKTLASQSSSLVSPDNRTLTHNLDFLNYSASKSVGFFANREMGFLFAQGEVLYTNYKANYLISSLIDEELPFNKVQEVYNNLDLHIIGGLVFKNFKIGVGPVFHKSLDFSSDLNSFSFYNEKRRNLNAGFQAMVAYDFGPMTIDLKYEDNFNNVGDHIYFGSNKSKFNSTINSITLGLGIGF